MEHECLYADMMNVLSASILLNYNSIGDGIVESYYKEFFYTTPRSSHISMYINVKNNIIYS